MIYCGRRSIGLVKGTGLAIGMFGVLGIFALVAMGLFVWALYVILTTAEDVWSEAGMNQWMWLAVVIFLPVVGTALFLLIGRGRLAEAAGIDQVQLAQ